MSPVARDRHEGFIGRKWRETQNSFRDFGVSSLSARGEAPHPPRVHCIREVDPAGACRGTEPNPEE